MQGGRDGKRARQDGGGNRANNKKRYLHKAVSEMLRCDAMHKAAAH